MEFLILLLATWRTASLLADEAGPLDVFARLRHVAGVRTRTITLYDDVGQPYEVEETYGTNVLARGLVCVWCVSVWCGAGWALLHYLIPAVAFWLALPLALSAGAILVSEVTNGAS